MKFIQNAIEGFIDFKEFVGFEEKLALKNVGKNSALFSAAAV